MLLFNNENGKSSHLLGSFQMSGMFQGASCPLFHVSHKTALGLLSTFVHET